MSLNSKWNKREREDTERTRLMEAKEEKCGRDTTQSRAEALLKAVTQLLWLLSSWVIWEDCRSLRSKMLA